MGFLNRGDKFSESAPEFIDILWRLGKIVGEFNVCLVHLADLVNRELPALVVLVDQPFDFYDVVLFKGIKALLDVVPHFCLDGPGAIHQRQIQIRLAALLGLDLFIADDEAGGDDLVLMLRRVSKKKLFHELAILAQKRGGDGFNGIAEGGGQDSENRIWQWSV